MTCRPYHLRRLAQQRPSRHHHREQESSPNHYHHFRSRPNPTARDATRSFLPRRNRFPTSFSTDLTAPSPQQEIPTADPLPATPSNAVTRGTAIPPSGKASKFCVCHAGKHGKPLTWCVAACFRLVYLVKLLAFLVVSSTRRCTAVFLS